MARLPVRSAHLHVEAQDHVRAPGQSLADLRFRDPLRKGAEMGRRRPRHWPSVQRASQRTAAQRRVRAKRARLVLPVHERVLEQLPVDHEVLPLRPGKWGIGR